MDRTAPVHTLRNIFYKKPTASPPCGDDRNYVYISISSIPTKIMNQMRDFLSKSARHLADIHNTKKNMDESKHIKYF